MTQTEPKPIGRVTRCGTLGFVGAVRLPMPDLPAFGAYCKAESQQGQSSVIGVIYDISIQDDELARQLATTDNLSSEQLADSQSNRQVPVEYSALSVGYQSAGRFHYSLPPQPPLTLAPVYSLTSAEVQEFTERLDMIRLILAASQVPVDELVVATLRLAANARPEPKRRDFLVRAGRVCAGLLAQDFARLDKLARHLAS